jgi:Domain of unknown function (DUF4399)
MLLNFSAPQSARQSGSACKLKHGVKLGLFFVFAGVAFLARAATVHPWLAAPPNAEATAYFSNLKTGAKVQSPFVLKFGLSLYRLAPAEQDIVRTGHHHLLIDQALPYDITAPIPFSERYRHFGKGQMEVVLDLKPGTHTFRLLLADHKHRPYFVYSPQISVEVLSGPSGLGPNYGKKAALEILGFSDNDTVRKPFRIGFHASGLNIAPQSAKLANTGTFQLVVIGRDKRREEFEFPLGDTETWLAPPAGSYTAQLFYIDNVDGSRNAAKSPPVRFVVE